MGSLTESWLECPPRYMLARIDTVAGQRDQRVERQSTGENPVTQQLRQPSQPTQRPPSSPIATAAAETAKDSPMRLEGHPSRRLRPRFRFAAKRERRQYRRRTVANDVTGSLKNESIQTSEREQPKRQDQSITTTPVSDVRGNCVL